MTVYMYGSDGCWPSTISRPCAACLVASVLWRRLTVDPLLCFKHRLPLLYNRLPWREHEHTPFWWVWTQVVDPYLCFREATPFQIGPGTPPGAISNGWVHGSLWTLSEATLSMENQHLDSKTAFSDQELTFPIPENTDSRFSTITILGTQLLFHVSPVSIGAHASNPQRGLDHSGGLLFHSDKLMSSHVVCFSEKLMSW